MKHPVRLSALDGRDPLGFLAAVGLLRFLTDEDEPDTALSFDENTATAILHSAHTDIDAIVNTLTRIITTRINSDGVLPGLPATFPAPAAATGGDPMRGTRTQYRQLLTSHDATSTTARHTAAYWIAPLFTDLAVNQNKRVASTPFLAPVGKQTIRTFLQKTLDPVRSNPDYLHQALTAWIRVPGVTGESFDHRAIRNAVDLPDGISQWAGVPGATWLAAMAVPLFRLTSDGTSSIATCWYRVSGRRTRVLIWPIWRPALNTHAVQTLLEHPALAPEHRNGALRIDIRLLRPLGIIDVAAAERLPLVLNSDGVLGPLPITVSID